MTIYEGNLNILWFPVTNVHNMYTELFWMKFMNTEKMYFKVLVFSCIQMLVI